MEGRGDNVLSHTTGMTTKLMPCTMMCNRQLNRFSRSFCVDSWHPLIKKMMATDPYRMVYSGLMGPPVAATSGTGFGQIWERIKQWEGKQCLLGHAQPKTHAIPKQTTSHCSARNSRYLFRGFFTFGFALFSWGRSFSESSGGIETVTTMLNS